MIISLCPNPCVDVCYYTNVLVENDTNRVENPNVSPGGKGVNAARVISRFNENPYLIAPIGGHVGRCFKDIIEDEGIPSVLIEANANTRINTILDKKDGEHILLASKGEAIGIEAFRKLKESVLDLKPDLLILGGSVPPDIPKTFYAEIIRKLRRTRIIVDADGKLLHEAVKTHPFAIKPNRFELERLVEKPLRNTDDVIMAALEVSKSVDVVLVSLGRLGALCVTQKSIVKATPPDVNVLNTVGAGDAFVGGFTLGIERNMNLDEALRLATACGTDTVRREGVKLCMPSGVDELMNKVKLTHLTFQR